jgi:hypothetical protein
MEKLQIEQQLEINDENIEDKMIDYSVDIRAPYSKSKEEKRLVFKQDLVILPLLSGSIFFGYLVSLLAIFNRSSAVLTLV